MAVMSCRDGNMALWATMLMMVKYLMPEMKQLEKRLRVEKRLLYACYALCFSDVISF